MIRERVNLTVTFQENFNSAILSLALLENAIIPNDLNESKLDDILGEFNLQIVKAHPGVLEYLALFTKGVGKFVWYAIKRDKEGIINLMKTFRKAEFMDFITKLDAMTLGLIDLPLDFVSGITGWEIVDSVKIIKNKAERIVNKMRTAIKMLKNQTAIYFIPSVQLIVQKKLDELDNMIDFHQVTKLVK